MGGAVRFAAFGVGVSAGALCRDVCARGRRAVDKSARGAVEGYSKKSESEKPVRASVPSFKLLDTRKNFDLHPDRPKYVSGPGPWITDLWSDDPIYDRSALYAHQERMNRPPLGPDDEESAAALCTRLNALMTALQDLDGQTLRMAKLHARIQRQPRQVGKFPLRVMRPGLPPGTRQRPRQEVDEVLKETHRLALMAQEEFPPPDSS